MGEPEYLPGVLRSVALEPVPKWPIALRNTRALHGALSNCFNLPHLRNRPRFTLLPVQGGCGWAAHFLDLGVSALPSTSEVSIFNAVRTLRLGPPTRLRAPGRPEGESHVFALETKTPVVIRSEGVTRSSPDAGNLSSALAMSEVLRLVVERPRLEDVVVEVLHHETEETRVHVGGEWGGTGTVVGWEGVVFLRCNTLGAYLLKLGEALGVGGRTSLGFGRYRLREVTSLEDEFSRLASTRLTKSKR
jgi:hypothetical protein